MGLFSKVWVPQEREEKLPPELESWALLNPLVESNHALVPPTGHLDLALPLPTDYQFCEFGPGSLPAFFRLLKGK